MGITPKLRLISDQAAGNYCKVLKNRLKKEGNQSVTNCNRLKLVGGLMLMISFDDEKPRTDLSCRQFVDS